MSRSCPGLMRTASETSPDHLPDLPVPAHAAPRLLALPRAAHEGGQGRRDDLGGAGAAGSGGAGRGQEREVHRGV